MTETATTPTQPAAQTEQAAPQKQRALAEASLPTSVTKFLEMRKKQSRVNLHDEVERSYLALYEDDAFRKLREAVYREQCVEGNFIDDDVASAHMLRDHAKREGNAVIMREKLSTIRRSISVVEKRYQATREMRRKTMEASGMTANA